MKTFIEKSREVANENEICVDSADLFVGLFEGRVGFEGVSWDKIQDVYDIGFSMFYDNEMRAEITKTHVFDKFDGKLKVFLMGIEKMGIIDDVYGF